MNEAPLLSPADTGLNQSYWLFVNPLTGKYIKFSETSALAVFVSEEAGRRWEQISEALQRSIGHEETLERIKAWTVVEREDGMNILPGTWAFKLKRYPDGKVKKFKARFCARGDRQKEGIDFTETYAPVAQWTTVRMMLILECLLGLKSKQGDISCAFLHAELGPTERIYVEMPRGFKQYDGKGRPKVLSLLRFLYGLRNSPRAFSSVLD